MSDDIDRIAESAGQGRNYDSPPLHLWHPPLSGDIDILIDAEGRWFHEGEPFRRDAIVRLFASILRREEDGEYYLVTPGEKWRIQVAMHPLLVTDVDVGAGEGGLPLILTLNTGKQVTLDRVGCLGTEPRAGGAAVLALEHGLTALFSRPAWYRFVELAQDTPELMDLLDQRAS